MTVHRRTPSSAAVTSGAESPSTTPSVTPPATLKPASMMAGTACRRRFGVGERVRRGGRDWGGEILLKGLKGNDFLFGKRLE